VLVKTILNRVHPLQSFVYGLIALVGDDLHVEVRPRKRSRPRCGGCGRRGPTYDTARTARAFAFVPLWGLAVTLWYCMRRVACPRCGITTERIPWADGKHGTCHVYRLFLARWAQRLAWSEVASIFGTSWGVVYRAIQWVVAYGLAHRSLDGVRAIGVDEIAVWTGHKYLTVVYQIDRGACRLLWVGRDRTEATFRKFFETFGQVRAAALEVIASDMWRPFLKVIAQRAGQAIHVLDRYHVVAKLNRAIDAVRTKEAKALRRGGYEPVLKRSRWCFLKRRENLTPGQRRRLRDVLRYDLKTVRAYLLKEAFEAFWTYTAPTWAGWFLDRWCTRAMRSRLDPLKTFAQSLRRHRELLLNWFRAKKEISSGTVEGLNLNAKLAIRKARGFRNGDVLETALYHQLGHLPEPEFTHRFC
jgi:transposase